MNKHFAKLSTGHVPAAAFAMVVAAATAWAAPAAKMGPMDTPAPNNQIAPNAPFLVHGKTAYLQSYKGQPLMLWQVTTWCPSCRAGLALMAKNKPLIDGSNIKIIVLMDFKNGGYPGDDMETFVQKVAPSLLNDRHFIFGEDTETLFRLYNPHHYIDVYQLIAANGHVAVMSSTPTATFYKIERFIKTEAKS